MKSLLITLIRIYQQTLSPLKSAKCPFTPTCSNYSIKAIEQYGILRGTVLSVWRVLRCNPFNKGYYDPPVFWGGKIGFKKKNSNNKVK